jgi:hypothetical protein
MTNQPQTNNDTTPPVNEFQGKTTEFVKGIEAVMGSTPLALIYLSISCDISHKEFSDFLKKHNVQTNLDGSLDLPIEIHSDGLKIVRKIESHNHLLKCFPESMLVTIISQFENFIGDLYRIALTSRELSSISPEKVIPLKDIMKFSSLDEIKSSLIDKEVSALLRMKTLDQIKELGDKIDLDIIKAVNGVGPLVEISERRNCIVHSKGIAGDLYFSKCSEAAHDTGKCKKGDRLICDGQYLEDACNIILISGVKIASLVWLKTKKAEREKVEAAFNEIGYSLIANKNYTAAISLFEFALNGKEGPKNEEHRLMYTINLAQAYKWSGNEDKCKAVLGCVDWKTKAIMFRLSKECLSDNFINAINLLKMAKDVDDINLQQLQGWPVFKKFRESDELKSKIKDIFGIEYEKFMPLSVEPSIESQTKSEETEKNAGNQLQEMMAEYILIKANERKNNIIRESPSIRNDPSKN